METKETDKRGTALERTYTKGLTAYGKNTHIDIVLHGNTYCMAMQFVFCEPMRYQLTAKNDQNVLLHI